MALIRLTAGSLAGSGLRKRLRLVCVASSVPMSMAGVFLTGKDTVADDGGGMVLGSGTAGAEALVTGTAEVTAGR